tara:strand:+ start:152 stop:592 length:441 start_codon:yes stop_codon:yes gene_type:complete
MSYSLFQHKRNQKSKRSSSSPKPPIQTFPPPPRPPPPPLPRSPPPPRSTIQSLPPAPHPSESLAKAVIEGFVFGTGSALAREAVNRTLKMPVGAGVCVEPERKKSPCELIETQIQECMDKVSNHGNFCSDLFEKYIQQCASQNTNP